MKVYILTETQIENDTITRTEVIGVYDSYIKALNNKELQLSLVDEFNGYNTYYCYDIEERDVE